MLNNLEKDIISQFMRNLDKYENETMMLIWNDNSMIKAIFNTCFEDENEYDVSDEKYEEFISFSFTIVSIQGNPPVFITEDNCFLVTYRNFPQSILTPDGIKIN